MCLLTKRSHSVVQVGNTTLCRWFSHIHFSGFALQVYMAKPPPPCCITLTYTGQNSCLWFVVAPLMASPSRTYTHVHSLVPRLPTPRFYLAAVEKNPRLRDKIWAWAPRLRDKIWAWEAWRKIHGCEIKSGRGKPGYEATCTCTSSSGQYSSHCSSTAFW